MKYYNFFFIFIQLLVIIIISSESTAKNKNGLTSPVVSKLLRYLY